MARPPNVVRLLLWIGALLISAAARAQTLTNPSFEDPYLSVAATGVSGTIAQGWSDNTSWAPGVDIQYSRDNQNVRAGLASQRIQINAGFAQFVQWMTFQPGRTSASIWLRSSTPTWVSLYLRGAGYTVYGSTTVRLTPAWQQVSVSAITPADAEGGLFINSASTGTLWLDDANVQFLGPAPAAPVSLSPPSATIPRSYFGLHPSHLFEPPFLPWPSIDFGTVRSHDAAPKWAAIEPNAPVGGVHTYDWSDLDLFIQQAESRGIRIIYTIYQTPAWAATSSAPDPYGAPGGASPPANIASYANFVTALATRYRGRIFAYEVWNEPDISFWTGTPQQMAELERACVAAVRAADPAALIVAPPPSGGGMYLGPLDWYERFLAAGGAQPSDVIAFHFYSDRAEQDIGKAAAFRSLLAAYGLAAKPLWHDESGIGYDGSGSMPDVVAHVARSYIINWALGVQMLAWYHWNEVSLLGIRQSASGAWTVRTPAAIAYDQVRSWLVGTRMLSCGSDVSGIWIATLERQPGRRSMIVWRPDGPAPFTPPSNAMSTRDLTGAVTTLLAPSPITVGPAPILIELRWDRPQTAPGDTAR